MPNAHGHKAHGHPMVWERSRTHRGPAAAETTQGEAKLMSSPARPVMWLSRPFPMGVDHLSIKQGCSPGCFLGLFLPNHPPHRLHGGSQTPVSSSQLGDLGC